MTRVRQLLFLFVASLTLLTGSQGAVAQVTSPDPIYILPISELRTWLGPADQAVSVRGVLTRAGKDSFVQDSSAGVMVKFSARPRLKLGDEVEVTGFPRQMTYGSLLMDANARVLWGGAPTPPVAVKVGQAARGDFDNQFIEVEAPLDGIERRRGSEILLRASADGQQFLAVLEDERKELTIPKLERHSMVRFRGICSMDSRLTRDEVPFILLMRSGDDAEQLAGPPWWTPALLLRDLLVVLCVILLMVILSIRVRHNRARALQQEREYIAHELHDTLAQSFAGVSFQLQAVRSNLPDYSTVLDEHLDLAINMVRYSHQEARRSIAALRQRSAGTSSIAQQVAESVRRMVGSAPLAVRVEDSGGSCEVPLRISNALVRVAQEAGANAVHHAKARSLTIRVIYRERLLLLTIEDDGTGFDPQTAKEAPGFGLTGMLARMREIHGDLVITSAPGAGTIIRASVPLSERRWWKHWSNGNHAEHS